MGHRQVGRSKKAKKRGTSLMDVPLSKIISDKPRKHPCKQERPRFRNGKVWPLSARLAGITKEDIEKSRIYHYDGKTRKPKDKKKTC